MVSENLDLILKKLPSSVKLVAVSKFHPLDSILEAYSCGQRAFGESRPQEFASKVQSLPQDIEWHFIGHLQTNKLKLVLPYVHLLQSVDSAHLLKAVDEWGRGAGRVTNVLLELHIGIEETKTGFAEEGIMDVLFNASSYRNVRFCGLMGMASNTEDESLVRADFERILHFFSYLKELFPELPDFRELSIGMSNDWQVALEYGATMVRIGTSIFGERTLVKA